MNKKLFNRLKKEIFNEAGEKFTEKQKNILVEHRMIDHYSHLTHAIKCPKCGVMTLLTDEGYKDLVVKIR